VESACCDGYAELRPAGQGDIVTNDKFGASSDPHRVGNDVTPPVVKRRGTRARQQWATVARFLMERG